MAGLTERELIKRMQTAAARIKKDMAALRDIQVAEGRDFAANECFGLLAKLNVWHYDASKALIENFPEFANMTRGPGR